MIARRLYRELLPVFDSCLDAILPASAPHRTQLTAAETLVPHAQLRLALESDPAMAALLPGSPGCLSLGDQACRLFGLQAPGLILLAPALLQDPAALAIAARWGMEALHARTVGTPDARRLTALLRHGAGLLEQAPAGARSLVLSLLPQDMAAELWNLGSRTPSSPLCDWLAALIGTHTPEIKTAAAPALECERPVESLLLAGGDSRLALDPVTQLNRYGVCPRPRPEAVHFSSSTASAISRHGFLFCDLLRRHLLDAALSRGEEPDALHRAAVTATQHEILRLLALDPAEADLALAASGTDSELLTALLSLAGAGDRPLTNLLVSPEESGKGVRLAGSGRFFDDTAASGAAVRKGAEAFPGRAIHIEEVAIRDEDCRVRPPAEVDAEILAKGRAALDRGHHLLVHVLLGSKTGLSAPGWEVVEQLVREAPERVDVAVDACQMRSSWTEMGDMVRRGWMVQISGSKFLTGPPFSGALLLPAALRGRQPEAARLLEAAPGVGRADDWSAWWAQRLPATAGTASLGPVFRWLPALLEGHLYAQLGEAVRTHAFECFRKALIPRFLNSPHLQAIDSAISGDGDTDLARLSIISFQVLGARWDGRVSPLNEKASLWLFEHLNHDITPLLSDLSPADRVTARLQCHIGQPVILNGARQQLAFLRLVLGARFFNMCGHADEAPAEAALQSQIADASRVLDKIELMASRWWQFEPLIGS